MAAFRRLARGVCEAFESGDLPGQAVSKPEPERLTIPAGTTTARRTSQSRDLRRIKHLAPDNLVALPLHEVPEIEDTIHHIRILLDNVGKRLGID